MKILQLVNRIPFPLNDGGNIGVHYYTQGFLDAGVELSMLAMNTTRHWVEISSLPSLFGSLKHFKVVKVDNRIKPISAFFNLFTQSSYNVDRFVTVAYRKALIEMLQATDYDIVQLEGLYLTPYVSTVRQFSKAKVVIRQHNVEYTIWERLAARAENPLKKWYLKLLTQRLKNFELKHLNDYDLMLPISQTDVAVLQRMQPQVPLYIHPFGIDVNSYPHFPPVIDPVSLYHIGAMDWLPNQESVNWLLQEVMPLLQKSAPSIKLHLAGRNMPQNYFNNVLDNVVVHGEVPDAQLFEKDKSILLVPLLSGGGVRIKIFQAMAMGKAVVTTSIGVEGIEANDGTQVLIADNPQIFAQKIISLVQHPEDILKLGAAARNLMTSHYDSKKLIAKLLERYTELIGN